jgi:hypothetical protein
MPALAQCLEKSSGCAVLLEPGSGWPNQAFAANADCDRVVVMNIDPAEHAWRLVDRIRSHSAEFERSGAKLRTVILSCAGNDPVVRAGRADLVDALSTLIDADEGKIVLESDPRAGLTTEELILSVGRCLDNLDGRSIAFLANDDSVFPQSTRHGSGMYAIEHDTLHDTDPYELLGEVEPERRASGVR